MNPVTLLGLRIIQWRRSEGVNVGRNRKSDTGNSTTPGKKIKVIVYTVMGAYGFHYGSSMGHLRGSIRMDGTRVNAVVERDVKRISYIYEWCRLIVI